MIRMKYIAAIAAFWAMSATVQAQNDQNVYYPVIWEMLYTIRKSGAGH